MFLLGSAAGKVYTWGVGDQRRLGHGDEEGSLVPKQVQVLAGRPILSVAAGEGHCLAVMEWGEVFSWGRDDFGQCGHGNIGHDQLRPRRVEVPVGARARSAWASDDHSLVVNEEGALYSFGRGDEGQFGIPRRCWKRCAMGASSPQPPVTVTRSRSPRMARSSLGDGTMVVS